MDEEGSFSLSCISLSSGPKFFLSFAGPLYFMPSSYCVFHASSCIMGLGIYLYLLLVQFIFGYFFLLFLSLFHMKTHKNKNSKRLCVCVCVFFNYMYVLVGQYHCHLVCMSLAAQMSILLHNLSLSSLCSFVCSCEWILVM